MNAIERPLSPMEYGIWLFDFAARTNFVFVAQTHGGPPQDALREAAAAAQARHALLRAAIVPDKKSGARFTACQTPIPIETVPLPGSPKLFLRELEREGARRFDTENGPLCRMRFFSHGEKHALLLVLHHSIADGVCGARLAAGLLADADALMDGRTPDIAPIPSPGPAEGLFPPGRTGAWPLVKALGASAWMAFSKNALRRYDFAPRDAAAPFGQRRQRYILRSLEPKAAHALAARAKQEKTSVHAALAAAQMLAVATEIPDKKAPRVPQLSLVDLRPRLPEPLDPRVMGLFISSVESCHVLSQEKSFWDLAREVRGANQKNLARGAAFIHWPALMRAIFLGRFTRGQDAKGAASVFAQGELTRPDTSIVSNIGRVDGLSHLKCFSVESLQFLMAVSGSGIFASSANSFNGRLHVNFTHAEPVISRGRARRMANNTLSFLARATE